VRGSHQGRDKRYFSCPKRLDRILEPMQSPVKWVPGFFSGGSLPGREVDRSPQSSSEVKNEWSYSSTPPPICFHGVDRDNFNLQCELAPETSWLLLQLLLMIFLVVVVINFKPPNL